jgi:hypothetical protein
MTFHVPKNERHVNDALALLLEQYKNRDRIRALLSALIAPFQDLENVFYDIYDAFLLDNATGEQLDYLGALVGEKRRERNDGTYRTYIRARIAINRSNGRIPELLAILRIVSDPADTYHLRELMRATMILHIQQQIEDTSNPPAQVVVLHDMMRQAKGGGVQLQTTWSNQLPENRFKFSSNSNAIETSSSHGFADAVQTTGGHIRGVIA